ncbi:hypothetical protein J2T20_000443 [Paenibacillus wynnii]|nr:hypothetical protein [Paenibacillus wynnii]
MRGFESRIVVQSAGIGVCTGLLELNCCIKCRNWGVSGVSSAGLLYKLQELVCVRGVVSWIVVQSAGIEVHEGPRELNCCIKCRNWREWCGLESNFSIFFRKKPKQEKDDTHGLRTTASIMDGAPLKR